MDDDQNVYNSISEDTFDFNNIQEFGGENNDHIIDTIEEYIENDIENEYIDEINNVESENKPEAVIVIIYPGKSYANLGQAEQTELDDKDEDLDEIQVEVERVAVEEGNLEEGLFNVTPITFDKIKDDVHSILDISVAISKVIKMDLDEGEMKLINFHGGNENQMKENIVQITASEYCLIECINCNIMFDPKSFQEHNCNYNESNQSLPISNKANEPSCIHILQENEISSESYEDQLNWGLNDSIEPIPSISPDQSGLLPHVKRHKPEEVDFCPSKEINYNEDGENLSNHISTLREALKCVKCLRIFLDPVYANEHIKEHYEDMLWDESDTQLRELVNFENFDVDDETLNFLNVELLASVLQCEFCDYFFSDLESLFKHSLDHNPENRFECSNCEIHCQTAKQITAHWQNECSFMQKNYILYKANIQRYFACNACNMKFESLKQLHNHRYESNHFLPRLNKNVDQLQFPCEFCNYISPDARTCAEHYDLTHKKKISECKPPTSSSARDRLYLCDICGKSYLQSSHLWQHMRFHEGLKPFSCEENGCTRTFTIRADLNDHIRKCHTGERPYHCVICDKRFLTGSVFYQHRLIHRDERRYKCDKCEFRFSRADALKNHSRIHTGEKPFNCQFCTRNFRQRCDRDKHFRNRHSHLDKNVLSMMKLQKNKLEKAASDADFVIVD